MAWQETSEHLVSQIGLRFLPMLIQMAEQLTQEYPGMKVHVYSGAVGTKTDWQGYDWGIDCFFPNAPTEMPDNTSISIEAGHLTTEPVLNASIGWPSPEQVFPDYQPLCQDTVEQIERELPRLFARLRQSLFEVALSLRIT